MKFMKLLKVKISSPISSLNLHRRLLRRQLRHNELTAAQPPAPATQTLAPIHIGADVH